MKAERYASVALIRPIHQLFTYGIPDALIGTLQPGQRIRVPLGRGRGTAIGFIAELLHKPGIDPKKVKPIIDLVDREPLVSKRMMGLTRWMANYYLCAWGELLNSALPPGGKASPPPVETVVRRSLDASPAIELPGNQKARKRVLEHLERVGETKLADLRRACSVTTGIVRQMAENGMVILEERVPEQIPKSTGSSKPLELNDEQSMALDHVNQALGEGKFTAFLLHGVTGSGKTEVYLRAAETALQAGKSVLYLVPEIALTPILAREIEQRFGNLAGLIHSGQTPAQRREQWRQTQVGEVRVVLGVRSALFAPLRNLGLVVVDEEHENTYKAGDNPRFHARDMAVVRAQREGAVALLGSATPSMESYSNATSSKYTLLELKHRIHKRPLAAIEVVDMAQEFRSRGKQVLLSDLLVEKLERTVSRGEQAMILLNRRGYAAFLVCRECGAVAGCSQCSVKLTWHRGEQQLRCHHCGHRRPYDENCDTCGGSFLQQIGCGTEQVEEELNLLFPDKVVDRMDQDTSRGERAFRILGDFAEGKTSILVGTQMIAKGHDFHRVTLVGILNADSSLGIPDFRTGERTFQLLTQAAGRAGRGRRKGEVVIQTFTPDHFSIRCASGQDYASFHDQEIRSRQSIGYPPATAMCCLTIRGRDALKTGEFARDLGRLFRDRRPPRGLRILGPVPAPLWKIKAWYRHQLILRSPHRGQLHAFLRQGLDDANNLPRWSANAIQVDVDPYHLL